MKINNHILFFFTITGNIAVFVYVIVIVLHSGKTEKIFYVITILRNCVKKKIYYAELYIVTLTFYDLCV